MVGYFAIGRVYQVVFYLFFLFVNQICKIHGNKDAAPSDDSVEELVLL